MTDLEDKNEWKSCIDITGVRLPTGYYFGTSAGTGDPSDNHDIISMKLSQLTVERTPEEKSIDWTKIEPGVSFLKSLKDNGGDPTGNFRSGPQKGVPAPLAGAAAFLPPRVRTGPGLEHLGPHPELCAPGLWLLQMGHCAPGPVGAHRLFALLCVHVTAGQERATDHCASDVLSYGFGNWSKIHTCIRLNPLNKQTKKD